MESLEAAPRVIGFLPATSRKEEDDILTNKEAQDAIVRIDKNVSTLVAHREGDLKEVATLKELVGKLESRLWWAVAGATAALGTAVLGLVL